MTTPTDNSILAAFVIHGDPRKKALQRPRASFFVARPFAHNRDGSYADPERAALSESKVQVTKVGP